MIRILLDTSAYSAFLRGHSDIKLLLQKAGEIYLNPIVLGELRAGFIKGHHLKKNENELQDFLSSPRVILLDMNEETAHRYAIILNSLWKAGTPVPTNDLWIAASAMQYGLQILTTDEHFKKIQHVIVQFFTA